MPLIKPRTNRVRSFRHISRLQEPNRDALVLYARFIGDTSDYVLNQLIETTIAKDREFVAWRAEHPDEVVVPSARQLGPEPPRSAVAFQMSTATDPPRATNAPPTTAPSERQP